MHPASLELMFTLNLSSLDGLSGSFSYHSGHQLDTLKSSIFDESVDFFTTIDVLPPLPPPPLPLLTEVSAHN